MAYCNQCGKEVHPGEAFCGSCGAPIRQAADRQYQQEEHEQAIPVEVIDSDAASSKGVALLSYIGFLWLIPFFLKRHSPFARFHVRQGATIFACELTYGVFCNTILIPIDLATRTYSIYGFVQHSALYHITNAILFLVWVFLLVISIVGIVKASTGQKTKLPIVSAIPFVNKLINKWYSALGVDVSEDE